MRQGGELVTLLRLNHLIWLRRHRSDRRQRSDGPVLSGHRSRARLTETLLHRHQILNVPADGRDLVPVDGLIIQRCHLHLILNRRQLNSLNLHRERLLSSLLVPRVLLRRSLVRILLLLLLLLRLLDHSTGSRDPVRPALLSDGLTRRRGFVALLYGVVTLVQSPDNIRITEIQFSPSIESSSCAVRLTCYF